MLILPALHDLHNTSQDFMTQFVSYFDAEKDPRNLMLVFSILLVPMTEWDIHSHAQDLFEAVFNYFPITFRPSPNDPYGITAQNLKDRLRHCIAASAELAPYAFPALLDKLDSTSLNTRRDVLQALSSCVENYGPHTVSLYSVPLWDALKFEVLQVQEEDLAGQALNVLVAIATQLSKGSSGALAAYLKPIVKEANEHLEDAPTKQSQATGRILESLSASSRAGANFIFGAVLPTLFALYESADNITKRRGLIEVLNGLIRANLRVYGEWRSIDVPALKDSEDAAQQPTNALRTFHAQILGILVQGIQQTPIKEVSYRLEALDALTNLTKARDVCGPQDVSQVISLLDDIVLNEEPHGNDDVKTACMNSLVSVAQQKPQLIIDKAFPTFMSKIPDSDKDSGTGYVGILEAFAKMAKEPKVFPTTMVRLRNKLNAAIAAEASPEYVQSLLAAALYALNQNLAALTGSTTKCPYYEDLIRSLAHSAASAGESSPLRDPSVIEMIGKCSNAVLRQQTTEFQTSILPQVYFQERGAETTNFPSFKSDASMQEVQLLLITTHVVASLRRDVELHLAYRDQELLAQLQRLAQAQDVPPLVRHSALQQISLLVDKFVPPTELPSTVDATNIKPNATNHEVRIAFAITKALLFRNAAVVSKILQTLLDALSSSSQGVTVSYGFTTLLQPDELLTKDNHCVISPLHKQKLFHLAVSHIASHFKSADSAVKKNYLVALSGILRWLPYNIIEPQLPTLTLILLQMLDLPGENDVKATAIDIMISGLAQQPKPLEEHASSLISRLLGATSAETNPPNVRSRALHCLALVPAQLKTEVVIPFRRQVIKRLTEALDDRRRTVRVEAVRCRSKWIELDEAGDDDE